MRGVETLWLTGMTHADIAMEKVVEREPAREGLSGYGPAVTRASVWEWKADAGGEVPRVDARPRRRRRPDPRALHGPLPRRDGLQAPVRRPHLPRRTHRQVGVARPARSDVENEHSADNGGLVSIR
jgi:hypothetical protein